MISSLPHLSSRREFLRRASALGATSLFGVPSAALSTEPPPETAHIRLEHFPVLCFAPLYLAEELLRLEGFSRISYVESPITLKEPLADLAIYGGPSVLPVIDSGKPVVVLAGLHVGCWELFGNYRVSGIRGLKGRVVAVAAIRSTEHVWTSSILAYVGMDPQRDITWVETGSIAESTRGRS